MVNIGISLVCHLLSSFEDIDVLFDCSFDVIDDGFDTFSSIGCSGCLSDVIDDVDTLLLSALYPARMAAAFGHAFCITAEACRGIELALLWIARRIIVDIEIVDELYF